MEGACCSRTGTAAKLRGRLKDEGRGERRATALPRPVAGEDGAKVTGRPVAAGDGHGGPQLPPAAAASRSTLNTATTCAAV